MRAREIDMGELSSLVMEVVAEVEKDLKKVQAKEVKPDGYADTLSHKVDWQSKLGINPTTTSSKAMLESMKKEEAKAIRIVKSLRAQRKAIMETMQKEAIMEENMRLRQAIKKIKSTK
jgi:hypothetical protein